MWGRLSCVEVGLEMFELRPDVPGRLQMLAGAPLDSCAEQRTSEALLHHGPDSPGGVVLLAGRPDAGSPLVLTAANRKQKAASCGVLHQLRRFTRQLSPAVE